MAGFAEKNSLYVSQAPGERRGPLLTLGANYRKRPSNFQSRRPADSAGTPAGRLDRGGAVLERKGKQRITFTIRVLYVKIRFMYLSFYIK